MTRSIRRFLPLLACCLWAQPSGLHIEQAQTKVEFTLGATMHTVHGSFQLKRNTLTIDPATGKASGELVVDAASGVTGNASRDKRMHEHVLESARYPEIVFRPDRIEGKLEPSGASQLQLHGVFTIHGADHEMLVPVSVQASAGQYTATAAFKIPYIKWGMKNPSTFVLRVGDQVDMEVRTVAR
jgi:polyisoprenoid-binding protein YceI